MFAAGQIDFGGVRSECSTWPCLRCKKKWVKPFLQTHTRGHVQWYTALVHVQPGRVVPLILRNRKSDSCFIAWMCQDICLSSTEPLGEYFGCCFISFFPFFPTSASTSPSAVFLFSVCMKWNKYHLWEGARASLALFFFYWKLVVTVVLLHLNLCPKTVIFLSSPTL